MLSLRFSKWICIVPKVSAPALTSSVLPKRSKIPFPIQRLHKSEMAGNETRSYSKHVKSEEVSRGKWIALNIITYEDPTGKTRTWEGISRTTKQGTEADAVGMITVFKDPKLQCECVILVRQYRPPLETYTIEFPAGLIDAGETAEQAAVREMREETGFKVKVKYVSPATSLDPGVGSTTLKIATCEVDVEDMGSTKPEPTDPDEFTEVIILPLNTVMAKLEEFTKNKDIVDSRVYSWALARCV